MAQNIENHVDIHDSNSKSTIAQNLAKISNLLSYIKQDPEDSDEFSENQEENLENSFKNTENSSQIVNSQNHQQQAIKQEEEKSFQIQLGMKKFETGTSNGKNSSSNAAVDYKNIEFDENIENEQNIETEKNNEFDENYESDDSNEPEENPPPKKKQKSERIYNIDLDLVDCCVCGVIVQSCNWYTHFEKKHPEEFERISLRDKCDICDVIFPSKISLEFHKRVDHPVKYRCNLCGIELFEKNRGKHMKKIHRRAQNTKNEINPVERQQTTPIDPIFVEKQQKIQNQLNSVEKQKESLIQSNSVKKQQRSQIQSNPLEKQQATPIEPISVEKQQKSQNQKISVENQQEKPQEKTPFIGGKIKCEICQMLVKPKKFENHTKAHNRGLRCAICFNSFEVKKSFRKHMFKVHGIKE